MKLVVFGGSGPTGSRVIRQALDAGHRIVAASRRPDDFPIQAKGLQVTLADVEDGAAVERLVAAGEAVISTFGVPYSRRPITVYSNGARNIVQAMAKHDVGRLVCVTSTTVREGAPASETLLWRRLVIPFLRGVVGKTLYDDMEWMEAIVRESPSNWTIVRPGGLYNTDAPTGHVAVSTRQLKGRFTSRADLAQVLIREATMDEGHSRAIIEAISQTDRRPPARLFLKEAFGKRA